MSDDLVTRLRALADRCKSRRTGYALREAADALVARRAAHNKALDERDALKAEVDQLQKRCDSYQHVEAQVAEFKERLRKLEALAEFVRSRLKDPLPRGGTEDWNRIHAILAALEEKP